MKNVWKLAQLVLKNQPYFALHFFEPPVLPVALRNEKILSGQASGTKINTGYNMEGHRCTSHCR